jgi:hypothetical protein
VTERIAHARVRGSAVRRHCEQSKKGLHPVIVDVAQRGPVAGGS